MPLMRLTRERYQRMREAGTFPEDPREQPVEPITPPTPPVRVAGAKSEHPHWFQVMALVRRNGAVDPVFVNEYPRVGDAIAAASFYPYRAIVVNCHSKREFDNWKPIEVEG
jgi:hypothetical protein